MKQLSRKTKEKRNLKKINPNSALCNQNHFNNNNSLVLNRKVKIFN